MKFFSKAHTLKKLKIKNAIIPKIHIFKFTEYKLSPQKVLKKINLAYKDKYIAIRSSFFNEDTSKSSNAGKFKSFLNIKHNDFKKIDFCIKQIRSSNKIKLPNDIFFVQAMVKNTKLSGVVLTKNVLTYSKCLNINYHEGSDTSKVTSGSGESKNLIYFKNPKFKIYKKFEKLEKLVDELEKIFKIENLDIEFAIDKNNMVYLLQVRRMIVPKQLIDLDKSQKNVFENLEKKINKLKKKHYSLFGKTTYFGNMPDWNPAEIIGTKPKPLALSLYQEIITDHVWAKNRHAYGYRDLEQFHLMTTFYGTPYIDIRIDFNSWLPEKLEKFISTKLCNYYLKEFSKNRNLQDKVEFDLLFTCATFSNKSLMIKKLKSYLSKKHIHKIYLSLKEINKNLINNFNNDKTKLNELVKRQKKVDKSNLYHIDKIYWFIEDCKRYGTLPFAGLARCGFVAIEILNSLVKEKYITEEGKNEFLQNINTIMFQMKKDLKKNDKKKFLKKYGHLRPNTYEITSKNYKENYTVYFGNNKKINKDNTNVNRKTKLNFLKKPNLKKIGFNCKLAEFENFIKDAIISREYSKFLFSKNIDLIFKNLIAFGNKYKISRKDLSYIKISKMLNMYFNVSNFDAIKNLKLHIAENKKEYHTNKNVILPDVINDTKDIYLQNEKKNKLNFISDKRVVGKIINLAEIKSYDKLNGIVCIENADPGFDFLFSKNIRGLITKYGGLNSHMAIRCAELNLPALIGIGKNNFENILKHKTISIDCLARKLSAL